MVANSSIDHRAIEKQVKEMAKAYERAAKKYPITVPVTGRDFSLSFGISGVGIEQDSQLVEFLIWLGQQPDQQFTDEDAYAEGTGMPVEDVRVLAHSLERDGLIDALGAFSAGESYKVSDDGRVELRRLARLRDQPAARHRFATDAFLRWLYATAHDQSPIDPAGFLGTADSHFSGAELSGTELDYALARLTSSGLIENADTEPKSVALTIDGIDCVLSGATVSDYLNRARPGDYYSITGTNIVAGSQGKVEQHNHNNGFDSAALREFAALVQQLAPVYEVDAAQQAELIHDAEVLSDEASSATPQPGRISSAYHSVMDRLNQIGAVTAALTTTIQQGQAAYSTVFGR
ncbi:MULTISPECIES: hypothetical protein [unclassified Streptomyces]|uniref:hypothetical protein n=1 Tax=unclassified Streptomyces TaxID=2593676 RepID=UPI002E2091A4|nr:hypothetical protein OG760_37945 [Streptomyces sp. NBC_00963]